MNFRPTFAACALMFTLALPGCAGLLPDGDLTVTSYQANDRWLNASFYLIEHPFTEDGSARAQARADRLCSDTQRIAVRGERACSLEKCSAQFVCMKPEDAKASGVESRTK
jgi:hypothetical protein